MNKKGVSMLITKEDVGRRVWSFHKGWGTIHLMSKLSPKYPVEVQFDNDSFGSFSPDGKEYIGLNQDLFWNEIKFSEPPKPKKIVKKTIETWGNVYIDKITGKISIFCGYDSEESADRMGMEGRISAVKLTGEYEVEE
jgi:hypothetical protein